MAIFLSGLLSGFLIKDWIRRNELMKINSQALRTLLQIRSFLTVMKPVAPETFLRNTKEGHWGVAVRGKNMFFVARKGQYLITPSEKGPVYLMEQDFKDIEIAPWILRGSDIEPKIQMLDQVIYKKR